jgi:hypothetical protein
MTTYTTVPCTGNIRKQNPVVTLVLFHVILVLYVLTPEYSRRGTTPPNVRTYKVVRVPKYRTIQAVREHRPARKPAYPSKMIGSFIAGRVAHRARLACAKRRVLQVFGSLTVRTETH